ncbi:HAD family hydrolase [Bacillus sp. CGMCC 1.16607]|uniref:HAD family hydrolase n=1 Tax=Bacillus sp. CGMCC 1.16607 TaxID=3351842 RepID=UPI00363382EB
MIKAIFFDLDDTLIWDQKSVKEAMEATCKIAEARYGIDAVRLEDAVRVVARNLYTSYETFEFTRMIGINPFEGLWGNFLEETVNFRKLKNIIPTYRKDVWSLALMEMGVDDPEFGLKLGEQFPDERKKRPYVFEDTYKTLDKLKDDYQLLLMTNGSPDLQHTKLELSPELAPFFEHIVISGDYGKGKPDPSIFEHAMSLLSLRKDEVLMVGDNLLTDILGANRSGIKSVWINRSNKVRNEIIPTYEIHHLDELIPILYR